MTKVSIFMAVAGVIAAYHGLFLTPVVCWTGAVAPLLARL